MEKIYQHYLKGHSVSTDSRKIDKDCVFFALKGERFDGNEFALEVAENNIASCVVADRKDLPIHERIFVVDDTLSALQELASLHRKKSNIPVIGITGTNGKTTTKELVAAVLSQKYNIIYTQGNFNNHIGVPLTLLNIKPETEIAIVEMGANHPGEIAQLCQIAQPDFGIITNIGKAHIEGFGSFEGIVKTKNELYDYLKTQNNKKVFVNENNELLMNLSNGMERILYGSTKDEQQIVSERQTPFLTINWDGNTIKTNLVGDYNYENVMAAISVGYHFNVEKNLIIKAIENYSPTNNRSQYIKSNYNEIVMDAYNANPTSMKHSINNFRKISGDNSFLILGDMKELGNESVNEHLAIIDLIKKHNFKNVFLIGNEFMKIKHDFVSFENVDELIESLQENPLKGMKILVKGSNSNHLEKLYKYL